MGTYAGGGRYYTSRPAQSLLAGAQTTQQGLADPSSDLRAYHYSTDMADMPPAAPWPAQLNVAHRALDDPGSTVPPSQTTSVAAVYDAAPPSVGRRSSSKRRSARRPSVAGDHQDSLRPDCPMSCPTESTDPAMESFSIRSPLQELEDKFTTKELKRRKLLEAEHRANQRKLKRRSRNVDTSYLRSVESFELPLQGLNQSRISIPDASDSAAPVRRSESGEDRDKRENKQNANGYENSPSTVNSTRNRQGAALPDRSSSQVHTRPHSAGKADDALAINTQRKRRDVARNVGFDSSRDNESSEASSSDSRLDRNIAPRRSTHTSTHDSPRRLGYLARLKSALTSHRDMTAIQEARRYELGSAYRVSPRTSADQQAKARVAFDDSKHATIKDTQDDATARFSGILGNTSHDDLEPAVLAAPSLEEWRRQTVARLILDDFALNPAIVGSRSNNKRNAGLDGATDERSTTFSPPLFLKCGPLLRYTGLRRERRARPGQTTIIEREVWRGSIMIVTSDDKSSYQTVPSLRLFAQSEDSSNDGTDPADLIAGRKTVSRTGRTLYIKPADQLPPHEDLSKVENGRGLFDTRRYVESPRHESRSRRGIDGESAGKIRHVNAIKLLQERGLTFWRFQIEIELGTKQARVAYRINHGPAIGFWVPGRNQAMNIMFHSCNGFSTTVDPKRFSGPDPLWRDVLNSHERAPYHVMIGGGDQIYHDAVLRDTQHFREWMNIKNPERKQKAIFSRQMHDELEDSYLQRYCTWYSQGLFKVANSQIPMVNMWDDHDIIDGYGSYPDHLMASQVFGGLGAVAFKYYMLFQHQSVASETYEHEPSWQLGIDPGPYIREHSRSLFMFLGRKIALLAVDCRTERMRDEIMTPESYELILNRCRSEIIKGETKHLLVLLGVPIAYPRLNFLENILTSKAMDPIKALGRTGVLGGFVNKYDGGIEILDNLDDHWTAKHHKKERKWFVQELQEIAAEKSVRITILGGDVHLAAVGQFHTAKARGVSKDIDHRYMLNVVSSAIVNEPPSDLLADTLNKRNKVHHLDDDTEETMCEVFTQGVDGRPRNNVSLLPHRNYCTITEYQPDAVSAPPPRPQERPSAESEALPDAPIRRYPPGSMGQSGPPISTFQPRSLIRRLSRSRERDAGSLKPEHIRAYSDSASGHRPRLSKARPSADGIWRDSSDRDGPSGISGYDDESVFDESDTVEPNFQGGLEITLNVEVDQGGVMGTTKPYGILVPALFYEEPNTAYAMPGRGRRPSIIDRLRNVAVRRSGSRSAHSEGSRTPSERSESPPPDTKQSHGRNDALDGAVLEEASPRVHFDDIVGPQKNHPVDDRRDSQQTPFMTPANATAHAPVPAAQPQAQAHRQESRRPSISSKQSPVSASPISDEESAASNKKNPGTGLLAYMRHKRAQNRERILRYERYRAARLERETGRKSSFSHAVPGLSTRYDETGRPHAPARLDTQLPQRQSRSRSLGHNRAQQRVTYDSESDESLTPSDTESARLRSPGDINGVGWTQGSMSWAGRR